VLNEPQAYDMVFGIDPGLNGAIAAFKPNGRQLAVYDMPTRDTPMGRREVDQDRVAKIIRKFTMYKAFAIVERVAAMTGKESPRAMFSFGRSYGILIGTLAAFGIQTIETRPNVWKCMLGLGSDKEDSLNAAKKLFPEHTHFFERKKDDGRAEAALLASLGENTLGVFLTEWVKQDDED
jgi:crossover junction endodeoxyribonuclease RuvC